MSNGELEQRYLEEQACAVADALAVTEDELARLEWSLEAVESDDGALYGYNIHFGATSDPAVLAKIVGLTNGSWVRIGPI